MFETYVNSDRFRPTSDSQRNERPWKYCVSYHYFVICSKKFHDNKEIVNVCVKVNKVILNNICPKFDGSSLLKQNIV